MEGDGLSRETGFAAKYSFDPEVTKGEYIRYSNDTYAILLLDATQTYLDFVASQPDATRLATQDNIDNQITTNQANTFKSLMSGIFVPESVANTGDTRREVLRKAAGMFLLSQRFQGQFGESWQQKAQSRGITLNSTWQDFPQVLKDEFIQVRDSFGWGNLGLSNTSTLDDILAAINSQLSSKPIYIAGVPL